MVTSFEGYLDSYEVRGGDIELRFAVGGFNPSPSEPPIFYVLVRKAENLAELQETLEAVRALDDYTYVEVISTVDVQVYADHEIPLSIRGESVSTRQDQYGLQDFERLARINREWGESQYSSLVKALAKLREAERLVNEQVRRVHVKMQGHPEGSTARTLYEQHLSFLERLNDVIKA